MHLPHMPSRHRRFACQFGQHDFQWRSCEHDGRPAMIRVCVNPLCLQVTTLMSQGAVVARGLDALPSTSCRPSSDFLGATE